jgi:hypothetical protein
MQLVFTLFGWATVIFRLAIALAPFVYVGSLYQDGRFSFILEHNIVIWSFVWMFVWSLFSFAPNIWSAIPVAAALEADDQEPEADDAATAKDKPVKVRKSKTVSAKETSDEETAPHPFIEDLTEVSSAPQLQLF